MGSCGDGDDKSKTKPTKKSLAIDLSDTSNHTFGSHFYSQSFSGMLFDLRFLQITMPFEDTVLLEDAFGTQVMNFGGETQAVNLGGEMRTLDNLDCFENIGIQWLDEDCGTKVVIDTDGGGTKVTKALNRTQELSDDDSVNRVCGKPVDQEKIHLLLVFFTQKLESQRHRLFAKHVKITRATMRLIKEGEHYRPAAKCK